jgi:hypothetical protein
MNIQHAATGENRYVVIEKTMPELRQRPKKEIEKVAPPPQQVYGTERGHGQTGAGEARERHSGRKGSGRCGGGARAGWVGVKWGRVCIEGRSAYKEAGSEKAGGEWALATIRSHELP